MPSIAFLSIAPVVRPHPLDFLDADLAGTLGQVSGSAEVLVNGYEATIAGSTGVVSSAASVEQTNEATAAGTTGVVSGAAEVSVDIMSATAAGTTGAVSGAADIDNSDPPLGSHSWWRIYITANNGDGNFTVADGLRIFDSSSNEISRVGASYFADSDDGLSPASNAWGAYNGGSNYWQSNSAGTFPRYIGIHLASPAEVNSFTLSYIRDPNRMPKTFRLEYSDDTTTGADGTWTSTSFWPDQTGWNSTLPPTDIRTFDVDTL